MCVCKCTKRAFLINAKVDLYKILGSLMADGSLTDEDRALMALLADDKEIKMFYVSINHKGEQG